MRELRVVMNLTCGGVGEEGLNCVLHRESRSGGT